MAMNRIQFQRGLSMTEFLERYGTEEQCVAALEQARWPKGFVCPRCQGTSCSRIETRTHPLYQCSACRHQTSLIAGTVVGAEVILTHCAEVKVTHLGEDDGLLAVDVDPGASSGDTSDGPQG